jgi:signal peptidase I
VLPLSLCLFGCGALAMFAYAGQIFVQVETVADDAMAPYLRAGWMVVVDNTAYWAGVPGRGELVSLDRPDGRMFRRLLALPGETVEIRDGEILVDDQPCDGREIAGAACWPGDGPAGALADLPPLRLPTDGYFVIAQDWNAEDSRVWGPIERAAVFGVPVFRRRMDGGFEPVELPSARRMQP